MARNIKAELAAVTQNGRPLTELGEPVYQIISTDQPELIGVGMTNTLPNLEWIYPEAAFEIVDTMVPKEPDPGDLSHLEMESGKPEDVAEKLEDFAHLIREGLVRVLSVETDGDGPFMFMRARVVIDDGEERAIVEFGVQPDQKRLEV